MSSAETAVIHRHSWDILAFEVRMNKEDGGNGTHGKMLFCVKALPLAARVSLGHSPHLPSPCTREVLHLSYLLHGFTLKIVLIRPVKGLENYRGCDPK